MTEVLGVTPIQGGAVALLGLVVVLILTGRLVPRQVLLDMREERDTWRAAHDASEAARQAEREQVQEMLELSRTAGHVLTSLPRPPREEVSADAPVDEAPSTPR